LVPRRLEYTPAPLWGDSEASFFSGLPLDHTEAIGFGWGETQSFVSRCERGERRLDAVELRAICKAIGLPFVSFIRRLDGEMG
jgi:hypothetical protein